MEGAKTGSTWPTDWSYTEPSKSQEKPCQMDSVKRPWDKLANYWGNRYILVFFNIPSFDDFSATNIVINNFLEYNSKWI